jgi:hypothetical protein
MIFHNTNPHIWDIMLIKQNTKIVIDMMGNKKEYHTYHLVEKIKDPKTRKWIHKRIRKFDKDFDIKKSLWASFALKNRSRF